MKRIVSSIVLSLAFAATTPGALLAEGKLGNAPGHTVITPYGDFCTLCSKYGIRQRRVEMREAVAALRFYFRHRGCVIRNIQGTGRFIRLDVYKKRMLVDKVIFDRKTGRLRSIY
jgi:hypothetical protein